VIPRAIDAALGRGSFRIFGDDYPTPDGTCLRDYVHVGDLAAAHLLALDALRGGAPSNAYNLGNGRPTSVRDVLASVERVTGRPVPHDLAPRREGDPAALFASSDRIKRELGWRPRYEELDVIVETAWRWRLAHPAGYATVMT
jgi:UDP-glucose 4-epimerase